MVYDPSVFELQISTEKHPSTNQTITFYTLIYASTFNSDTYLNQARILYNQSFALFDIVEPLLWQKETEIRFKDGSFVQIEKFENETNVQTFYHQDGILSKYNESKRDWCPERSAISDFKEGKNELKSECIPCADMLQRSNNSYS